MGTRLEFSLDFFRDEVRNGFYIPGAIKQAWAASMMVLDEIDKICKKYDINYFADWGTLLGAVRHGGFIPWDDDIDICMKREDYDRFKEVAEKELPENFCLHDYMRKDNHWLFLTRVVNHRHICFEEEHLRKYHNFPYLASVDIFVLDYLYDDKEKEHARCEEIKYLIALADLIVEKKIDKSVLENELDKVTSLYKVSIDRELDSVGLGRALYSLAEQQMRRVKAGESHNMGQIFPHVLKNEKGFALKLCDKAVTLPFEFGEVPCPIEYNYLLNWKYGRFFKINKKGDGHQYPYFEQQKKNLQEVTGLELSEFHFSKEMLIRDTSEHKETFQKIVGDSIEEINRYMAEYEKQIQNLDFNSAIGNLPKCQSLAIELGNYIEKMVCRYISGHQECISKLEAFCEALFYLYDYLNNEFNKSSDIFTEEKLLCIEQELKVSLKEMEEEIKDSILKKRLIAFLPDNPNNWKEMEILYNTYLKEKNTDILVIPLPVFSKNPYGEIVFDNADVDYTDNYPYELNVISWDDIDISMYEFDTIIIQNPYDNENGYLTVPPAYYAEKLKNYTNCLVYFMKDGVDDFGVEDTTSMYGLKYRLRVPAAMYADKIIIHSEKMKALYEDYLTEFAGENTRNIWREKLVYLKKQEIIQKKEEKIKEVLLYCIGEDQFVFDEKNNLRKIKERFAIIDNIQDLEMYVYLYPGNPDYWDSISEDTKECLKNLTSSYKVIISDDFSKGKLHFDEISEYYGSPSPVATEFIEKKKNVMISGWIYSVNTLYYNGEAYLFRDYPNMDIEPAYFEKLVNIT